MASVARWPPIRAMSYGLRIASVTTGTPVATRRATSVRCGLVAVTLYVPTTTTSLPAAAATASSILAAVGVIPVESAVAVKPSSVRAVASVVVGGPVVPDGEAGSAPTTRTEPWRAGLSGRNPPSLSSRVVVASAIRSAWARWAAVPTFRSTPARVTYAFRNRPSFALSRRIRRIDSSSRPSVSSPLLTAFRTAFHATSSFGGLSSWSTPAFRARTGTRSSPYLVRTPSMPSASVTTTPS